MNRWLTLPLLLALPLAASAGKVTLPDAQVDGAYAARRVALLIGVDSYSDPDLEPLRFAGKDARDVAAVLSDDVLGGYDKVRVLNGPEATSRAAILQAIRDETADLQRDDTFLIYLSGHGTLTLDAGEGTRLWFLPSDAELNTPSERGIDVAWLEETLSSLTPRRRVLIMDTCHNGRADGSRAALSTSTRERLASLRGDPPAPNPVAEVTESEARLFAAQYYQPAMEDKALGNGVYTHFLIQSLSQDRGTADLNRDGLVDVTEAHDYAMERTIRHTGGLQVPRAEYHITGREAIYLAGDPSRRVKAENALVSAYNGLLASASLFIDGQSRGALPGVIAVEPGKHRLEVQTPDGRTIYASTRTVHAGEHIQVESLGATRETEFSVALGAVASTGSPYLSPLAPELEAAWRPGTRGRFQPVVYGRVSVGGGVTDASRDVWPQPTASQSSVGGVPGLGGFFGYRASDKFTVGPELELLVPWRRVACTACAGAETPVTTQGMPSPALGARIEWRIPVGRAGDALVRYDVRAVPLATDLSLTAWDLSVAQGLSIGASFR